jgi:hypothetical protein
MAIRKRTRPKLNDSSGSADSAQHLIHSATPADAFDLLVELRILGADLFVFLRTSHGRPGRHGSRRLSGADVPMFPKGDQM